jgi:iron complex outermembrane receptor protein
VTERGVRATWFGEASIQGAHGRQTWVVGTAFQQDRYRPRELTAFRYTFSTPSIFAQDEIAFGRRLAVALSARVDLHSAYGGLATPRVSLLARPRDGWRVRMSGGTGAFAPTPFTEETEETGLTRVLPLRGIRAERAGGGSIDVTRTTGPVEVSATLFGSRVAHPLQLRLAGPQQAMLVNAAGPTRSWGTELLARYRIGPFVAIATHAWTRSTEDDADNLARRDVPLTPTHTASFNVMWESERQGRVGVESYYIGRQSLDDNPYRLTGRPQLLLGALIERVVGRARLFLNSENLLNVRQTADDPLVLPRRAPDGRWTVDAWAPLEGRVFNGGIRVAF